MGLSEAGVTTEYGLTTKYLGVSSALMRPGESGAVTSVFTLVEGDAATNPFALVWVTQWVGQFAKWLGS